MACRTDEHAEEPHGNGSARSVPRRMPIAAFAAVNAPDESGDIEGEEEAEEKKKKHDEHLS